MAVWSPYHERNHKISESSSSSLRHITNNVFANKMKNELLHTLVMTVKVLLHPLFVLTSCDEAKKHPLMSDATWIADRGIS